MKKQMLKNITRFKIGGPADVITVRKTEDIPSCIAALQKGRRKFFVLGSGTNIIASDAGYGGVILRIATDDIHVSGDAITCDAGVSLQKLIDTANARGLSGLQTLAGIPGTVGGAIYGNAGAYGKEIAGAVKSVTAYDGKKIRILPKTACVFGYRESIFKKKKWVILSALFQFEKGNARDLKKISQDIIMLRLKKYKPRLRCAGSIFKNILAKSTTGKKLLSRIPKEKVIKGKIPAGFLLESVGAKGMKRGGIRVASHHGNLIVNDGTGTAKEARSIIHALKKRVRAKYGITLEEEVRYVE